jgi:hypothetical protein
MWQDNQVANGFAASSFAASSFAANGFASGQLGCRTTWLQDNLVANNMEDS